MYPYRDDEYFPAYLQAYPFGFSDTSNFDESTGPNNTEGLEADPASVMAVALNSLGYGSLLNPGGGAPNGGMVVPGVGVVMPFGYGSSPAAFTGPGVSRGTGIGVGASMAGDGGGGGGPVADYAMTDDWAAAAANGVSCWDYPDGVPVWVPGPYGSNPTGTPQTGPQCWRPAKNSVPQITAPLLPQATIQNLPSIVGQANASGPPVANNQIFSPSSLLNPLPQIVAGPKASPQPQCNPITQWVNDNPMFAAGVLALGLMFALKKK